MQWQMTGVCYPSSSVSSYFSDPLVYKKITLQNYMKNNNNIIVLYYRLAEHIDRYMAVVQYIVITLHTQVQLLSSQ